MLAFKFYPKLDKHCTKQTALHKKNNFFIKNLFFIPPPPPPPPSKKKKSDLFKFTKEIVNRKIIFSCNAGFGFHELQKPCKETKTTLMKHED